MMSREETQSPWPKDFERWLLFGLHQRGRCEQGGSVPQFPGESAIFKVKRHLPELKSPDSENAVKIVSLIFPVVHQECGLRS